jgi:hypothetical protein
VERLKRTHVERHKWRRVEELHRQYGGAGLLNDVHRRGANRLLVNRVAVARHEGCRVASVASGHLLLLVLLLENCLGRIVVYFLLLSTLDVVLLLSCDALVWDEWL